MNLEFPREFLDGRGHDYLQSQFTGDDLFTAEVSKRLNFRSGSAWTWSPECIERSKKYDFKSPELIKANSLNRENRISAVVRVETLFFYHMSFILDYLLRSGPGACCILEHTMLKSSDPDDYFKVGKFNYGKSVLLVLTAEHALSALSQATWATLGGWRSIGFLSNYARIGGQEELDTNPDVSRLISGISTIFSAAYDSESYVYLDGPTILRST